MQVVIDTNVLVSALMSRSGNPADIVRLMFGKVILPCYDYRVMEEYRTVLNRPRFGFIQAEIQEILAFIESSGLSVLPLPLNTPFMDESDKAFYEVARFCGIKLITGNKKHYPDEPDILAPAEFLLLLL